MNIVDTNLLMYAHDEVSPFHSRAQPWLETLFSDRHPIGIALPVVTAFIRITTNRRLRGGQFTMAEALDIVDEWLSLPNVRLLLPTDRHWSILRRVLIDSQSSGPVTTDAQIAAITIEYGGILHTNDRDFARFPGLRWVNPLEPK